MPRLCQHIGVGNTEFDQLVFGLVGEFIGDHFEGHRKANGSGRVGGGVERLHQALLDHRYAGFGEDTFRIDFMDRMAGAVGQQGGEPVSRQRGGIALRWGTNLRRRHPVDRKQALTGAADQGHVGVD